jgi:hypothetical protein
MEIKVIPSTNGAKVELSKSDDDEVRQIEVPAGSELTLKASDDMTIEVGDVVAEAPTGEPSTDDGVKGENNEEADKGDAPIEATGGAGIAGEFPEGLAIGRVVWYRSRTGAYDLPAIVSATTRSLDPTGVELGHVPELTNQSRVHLTVFTSGIPGTAREGNEVNNDAAGGTYQEFNVPLLAADATEIVAGTWRWPERA